MGRRGATGPLYGAEGLLSSFFEVIVHGRSDIDLRFRRLSFLAFFQHRTQTDKELQRQRQAVVGDIEIDLQLGCSDPKARDEQAEAMERMESDLSLCVLLGPLLANTYRPRFVGLVMLSHVVGQRIVLRERVSMTERRKGAEKRRKGGVRGSERKGVLGSKGGPF